MKKWSINALFVGGILLVILAIGFVLYVSIQQSANVKDSTARVEKTHAVLHQIRRLEQSAVLAIAGSRGYVITGEDRFLLPVEEARESMRSGIIELRKLVSDNPEQTKNLDSLEIILYDRLAISDSMVSARRLKGLEEAIAVARKGESLFIHGSVRLKSKAMVELEESLLKNRRSRNDANLRSLNAFMYTILGAVLILSVLALWQIRRRMYEHEANEKKFAALLDAAPDATVIVDRTGTIRMVNQQVVNLFGYGKSEILGKSVEMLVPQNYRSGHQGHREGFFGNPKVRGMGVGLELHALRKDRSLFPVEISLSPIKTVDGWWVSASVRDITHRKKLEDTLRKANEEMEAFTYSVSHDLRAPLRGITGFTSILEEDYSSQLDDEARRITSVIKANTARMSNLIDDLLTFSRTGKQELLRIEVDMDKMVRELSREVMQQYPHPNISFSIHPLPAVNADKNTIKQVWINLISNALKYSAKKEEVRVEVGSERVENETVFFVRDNGIGFDNKYSEKLFRVFQRLHSADEFEGTGVGLALVEKIVAKHGGRVWAEGEVDKGACFYFTLPD